MNPIDEYEKWDPVSYSDSDWAGDPETRISITGFVIYLLGAPICLEVKRTEGVTLSSSEAEYIVMSEAVKEIRSEVRIPALQVFFVCFFLGFLFI